MIVGSSALAMPELMANAIKSRLPDSDKPIIAYVSPHAPHIAALLTQSGVPAFSAPESCASALGAMFHAGDWVAPDPAPSVGATPTIGEIPRGSLDEAQAKRLFAACGIPGAREIVVTNSDQAVTAARELGDHVVLKVLSSEILHKSDVGGVAAGLSSAHRTAADRHDRRQGRHRRDAGPIPCPGDGDGDRDDPRNAPTRSVRRFCWAWAV